MPPAHQSLVGLNTRRREVEDRLVLQQEFASVGRTGQFSRERASITNNAILGRAIKVRRFPAILLGSVKRDVGAFEQGARILRVSWREGNARTGAAVCGLAIEDKR